MSFAQLDQLCRRLEALAHAQAMLGVDEAVAELVELGKGHQRFAFSMWSTKRLNR